MIGKSFTQARSSRKMNNYDNLHLKVRMMDLTDLHIFRSVVQAGGVTRAAEKLNRVQSNITTRVRQLETELGVELFVREGKRLHLSSAGKRARSCRGSPPPRFPRIRPGFPP